MMNHTNAFCFIGTNRDAKKEKNEKKRLSIELHKKNND